MMKKKVLILGLGLMIFSDLNSQNKVRQQAGGGLGGRTFVYGEDVRLPREIKIDENDSRQLSEILDEALEGTGIRYRITDSHVLLFRQRKSLKQHTVYGYVIDAESKECLIGANVYVPLLQDGNTSNEYGHFSLTLPEGETFLQTSYVGYKTDTRSFNLENDTLITIAMKPKTELAEVVVESDRPETGIASSRSGAVTIPVTQIFRTPSLLGETDIIKAIHLQPGVQPSSAGQVGMSVRGGNTDQNLFLLDAMLLYNVDHVMGFESAFMPDAVKHVDFYRGSFPARYGGRLSSVTDVRTKDGDMQNYHGTFSIGLLSSHLSFEGPIWKDRTSFIVSARRTYLDWILNYMPGIDIDLDKLGLFFYDFTAKINHKFSDKDRLYLSYYSGRDVIDLASSHHNSADWGKYDEETGAVVPAKLEDKDKTKMDLRWGNTLYHLRWNHIFSPKLFANMMVGYNRFSLNTNGSEESSSMLDSKLQHSQSFAMMFKSGIDDFSSAIDFDYHPTLKHHVRMGAQYIMHTFRPEVQSSTMTSFASNKHDINELMKIDNDVIKGHEASLYAEDDLCLNDKWQLNAGMRAIFFTTDGKTFPNFEPRVSVSRELPNGFKAKGSYTVMHQYVHKLQSSMIASPSDLWVPVTKNMKPMSAHQATLSLTFVPDENGFASKLKGWDFSMDVFYKKMNNVIDFIDGASFQGGSKGWENKIATGKGRAYGVEFNANKTVGKTTGMLNYTLSKADRWYPDGTINGGRHFPYRYDRRHVAHLLIQHQLTKRIDLNASWNYMSGALTSIAKQQSDYIKPAGSELEASPFTSLITSPSGYISGRNNYRLEPTHQLDISINFHRETKHGERIWNISLMNAYCHKNQDLLYADLTTVYDEDGAHPKRVLKQYTIIPFIPSFTYTYKF